MAWYGFTCTFLFSRTDNQLSDAEEYEKVGLVQHFNTLEIQDVLSVIQHQTRSSNFSKISLLISRSDALMAVIEEYQKRVQKILRSATAKSKRLQSVLSTLLIF